MVIEKCGKMFVIKRGKGQLLLGNTHFVDKGSRKFIEGRGYYAWLGVVSTHKFGVEKTRKCL